MAYTRDGGGGGSSKARWSELVLQNRNHPTFKRRRRMLGVVLLGLVLAGVLVAALGFSVDNKGIRRGVEVGGVDVGGMSRAEARNALGTEYDKNLSEIRFGDSGKVPADDLGVELDAQKSAQRAYEVGRDGWFGKRAFATLRGSSSGVSLPAAVTFDRASAKSAVSGLADGVSRRPENATYQVSDGKVEVKEGKPGRKLDQQETLANLAGSLKKLDGRVPVATKSVAPQVPTSELADPGSIEKLGEFKSDYRYSESEARRTNLKRASEAMDGTVLAPGEEFSFNAHATKVDYEKALVFGDGGETSANGGGLCQVASTLYMAAQYAGLDITERSPHYAVLPYIRPGFDATVWFGGAGIPELDMKFKNTTDADIYIREYVDEKGIMHAEIWGQPTGKKVTMRSEQDFRDLDRGLKWTTYKKVTKDGKVLREGPLHSYVYSFPPPDESDSTKYNPVRVGSWSG